MKEILKKVNETGTLLVEAMAMLGLIAMVTPVLYKKASERTVELQDVNASAQMRALSSAIDSYLKDNFARITKGEKIANSAGNEVDFGVFDGAENGQVGPLSISHFMDYLPYGFLNENGTPRETKLFDNKYNVIIKLESDIKNVDGVNKVMSQTLTGFVTATPKIPDEIGNVRASRIASMIGSNGGYVITEDGGQVAMGAQGIWSVPTSEFDGVTLADNTFVVSSVQPISSQGLANEDVLHRKNEPDANDELNTMETDLFMGYTTGDTKNIRLVNQIIMHPDIKRMVKGTDVASQREEDIPEDTLDPAGFSNTLDKALYIAKGGGAYVEGALQAMNSLFTVKEDGIKYYGTNSTSTTDPDTGNTTTTTTRANDPTLKIDGAELVYGDPGAGKAKLTVKSAGSMSFGTSAVPANGGTPAQAGVESLYADKANFRAGDGNLNMTKDGTDWYTVIKKDAAGNATAHEGGRSTYVWEGGAPRYETEKTGKYEVSINGSAFVKDTMLAGKLKAYDVDAGTLRAGIDRAAFNAATDDNEFYIVAKSEQIGPHDYGGSFIVGTNEIPMMTIADGETTDNTGRVIPGGVSISTADALEGARGIDIAAGNTGFMTYEKGNSTTAESFTVDEDAFPDDNTVRIGGLKGVFLSAYTGTNNNIATDAPVSINDVMFRAWRRRDYNGGSYFDTIDQVVDSFNIFSTQINTTGEKKNADSYWRSAWSRTLHGRMFVGDTAFIVGTREGNPIFEAFPAYSPTGTWTTYPDYNAAVKVTGGMAIYDYTYNHLAGGNDNSNSKSGHGRDAAIYANIGRFEIRSTIDDETRNIKKKDKLLVVDSHQNATYVPDNAESHGSIYIRKGSIALESNYDKSTGTNIPVGYDRNLTNAAIDGQYKNKKDAVGYIAADRFISHYKPQGLNFTEKLEVAASANHRATDPVAYDGYEVNPAYTSVMHDIKLTTRGGARLSDILPDFINKGIYLVDTSYAKGTEWGDGKNAPSPEGNDLAYGGVEVSMEQEVSEYAGFIPTPKCPPLYAKVATLTPSGWAMAQAGLPYKKVDNTIDVNQITNPNEYLDTVEKIIAGEKSFSDITPLTFQKSTWLRSMVLPCYGSEGGTGCQFKEDGDKTNPYFWGWGAVMGFIYPESYYTEYVGGTAGSQNVWWNLFPVYYRQIEGYATVYCYFDRSDENYTAAEVDKDYNQLEAFGAGSINSYEKGDRGNGTEYLNRLNDPKLKYDDPW